MPRANYPSESKTEDHKSLQLQCEQKLDPLNVKAIHESQSQLRLSGTCLWIWTEPTFANWRDNPSLERPERLIFVYGPPGCGKTVMASSIAESLTQVQGVTLFYSFSGMDADRQTGDKLVRTLYWQLLQIVADNVSFQHARDLIINGPPTNREIWTAIQLLSGSINQQMYCIIDGIDECSEFTEKERRHWRM
jgi:hypothetical protein